MVTSTGTRSSAPSSAAVYETRTRIYYWWLLLSLFFEYVRPGTFIPAIGAIKLGSIIAGGLLLAMLFAPGLRPWKEIFSDRYAKWLVAYIGLVAVSLPFAVVTLYAYQTLTAVLLQFTLFLMIVRVATSLDRLRGIFVTLMASHLVLIVLNPALILSPETRSYVRGAPFLGDGNDFSLSLCILVPLAIEIALRCQSKWRRVAAWTAVLALLLAIVGTQSRGASLSMAVVFGFLWLYSSKKFASLLAVVLVCLVVLAYAPDAYFARMQTIGHYESDGSAEGRITAWKRGAKMGFEHPLTGVGAGHFPVYYGAAQREEFGGGRWLTAHSMYFLVFGELGFPGIVTLLALVIGSPLALMSLRRRVLLLRGDPQSKWQLEAEQFLRMLTAGCIGFAVAGAFLSVAYYPHVFVLTAVAVAARLSVKAQLEQSLPPVASQGRVAMRARRSPLSGTTLRVSRRRGVHRDG